MPQIKQTTLPKSLQNRWIELLISHKSDNFIKKMFLKYKLNKEFKSITPNIEYMREMANALIFLSAYFLYPNDSNTSIIASHKYGDKITIFLNPNEATKIEITIKDEDITLTTFNSTKKMLSISWKQSQVKNVVCNIYEEELFIRIINLLMYSFRDVVFSYL